MAKIVKVNREELKRAIRKDCVTIFAFYLQDQLTLEVPEFHQEIWEELLVLLEKVSQPEFIVGHLQKLFAVPREHSKTTLIKIAVILFMRYSPLRFTLYTSKTNTMAVNAIKDIVAWFKSPQEVDLYGPAIQIKANESESIWIYDICLDDGSYKRIILKALGAQQQVRGMLIDSQRPELIIMDDIEDYDTADAGPQQKKLDEWVVGSLLKASARRSIRILLGNMVRSTTLLARLAQDAEWNPTVFGALVRHKVTEELLPLWPGRWTVSTLLEDYRSHRKKGLGYIWETEMMNLSGDKLLMQSLENAIMIPAVSPEEVTAGFICLDPAFGKESWHDSSAITVHVHKRGYTLPILVDHRKGKWAEDELFRELIELSHYWNLTTWVIESVAAQRLFIPYFRLLMFSQQINPDVFTLIPIQAGKETKASRILAFRQSVASGSYAMAESQIDVKLSLEEYSPTAKSPDDLNDSAAYGPIVWSLHGMTIESNGAHSIAGQLMQDTTTIRETVGEQDVCQF